MANKSKKQIKIEQANAQSDALDMGYSDGIQMKHRQNCIRMIGLCLMQQVRVHIMNIISIQTIMGGNHHQPVILLPIITIVEPYI